MLATFLDALQWPAMALTVAASWFVGSRSRRRRGIGFWLFIAGNVLWVAWGVPAQAWALVVLQFCLAALNVRGAMKAEPASSQKG